MPGESKRSQSTRETGDEFEERIEAPISRYLNGLPWRVERGFPLRYVGRVDPKTNEITNVYTSLEVDLVVLRDEPPNLPLVVIEAKTRGTTDNLLTAAEKVLLLRRSYPWIRFGFVVGSEKRLKMMYLWHARAFDFLLAVGGLDDKGLESLIVRVIERELGYAEAGRIIVGGGRHVHREYPAHSPLPLRAGRTHPEKDSQTVPLREPDRLEN